MLECSELGEAVRFGYAASANEVAQGRGGNTPTAYTGQRWHSRIIPAIDVTFTYQARQDTLRHHRIGDVEASEFVLMWTRGNREVFDEPIVQRPMILEFQRADRVGNALDRVGLTVRVIVGWVDAPGIAGPRVFRVQDTVENRVTQVHVG